MWKFFSFHKNEKGKKAMLCYLCKKAVVHTGDTTNLKNHLFIWHRPEYNATSECAKVLTQAVAEFIGKDLGTYG